jgi:hypothetical protein
MIPNRRLLLPYAAPYFAYVAIASLLADRIPSDWSYALRLLVVPALLAWAWRWYPAFGGPRNRWVSVAAGAAVGLVGIVLWIALLWPFAQEAAAPWTDIGFALRLVAAGAVVPVFEELLMRGFLLRLAVQWDRARQAGDEEPLATALDDRTVADVEPGAWTWASVALSTLAFTLGHQVREWPAAVVFGLLMAWLWAWRKDLVSCVAAHSAANIALALFVRGTGKWGLW